MSTHTATVPPHGSHSDASHGHITVRTLLVIYGALLGLGVYSYWASRIRKSLPAGHPERLLRARK